MLKYWATTHIGNLVANYINTEGQIKSWKQLTPPDPTMYQAVNTIEEWLRNHPPITSDASDYPIQTKDQKGVYTIKSNYKSQIPNRNTNFRKNRIWRPGLTPKIAHFLWLCYHNKILTRDNLNKKGLQGRNVCILCLKAEETVQHLILACGYTLEVWRKVSDGFDWVDSPIQTLVQK